MRRLIFALLLLASPASAQVIAGAQVSDRVPITNGMGLVTMQLVQAVTFSVTAGEVYLITVDGEFAPYQAGSSRIIMYPLALTNAVYACENVGAPSVFSAPKPMANARPCPVVIAPLQGEDIAVGYANYYSKISRPVLYQASQTGVTTIAVYAWGLSTSAVPGDMAYIFAGTGKIQAVRVFTP